MFEGLFQPTHLIIILVIVLIIMGPGKLPEIGGAIGKSVREFRRSTSTDPEPEPPAPAATTASPAMKVCASCQTENPATSKFCGTCGKELA